MGKKFIVMGGKKIYLEEEKDEPGAPAAEPPVGEPPVGEPPTAEPPAPPAGDLEAQAKSIGQAIAKEFMANIDLKSEKKDLDSKIAKILHGKDLTDKDSLTPEEKIVGFYHALVTRNDAVVKALSEGTAADGGNLFPDEFRAELIKSLVGPFTMRGLVRTIPMKKDVMNMPGLGSRPKVYWTAENETKTTTTADFSLITLTARKVAAILYASDELVEDSDEIDVVRLVIDLFADAIKDEEDKVICQGNGTTQPTGLNTAVTAGTIPSRVCAGNLDYDDIVDLTYDLPQAYRANARFLAARANVRELRKLKDSNGQYLWQPSLVAGQPATLNGYPIIEQDYIGEANILFGDFKMGYWIGDRKMMTVKVSQDTETAFTKDQTAIRVVERIAGNVVLGDAIRALTTIP